MPMKKISSAEVPTSVRGLLIRVFLLTSDQARKTKLEGWQWVNLPPLDIKLSRSLLSSFLLHSEPNTEHQQKSNLIESREREPLP